MPKITYTFITVLLLLYIPAFCQIKKDTIPLVPEAPTFKFIELNFGRIDVRQPLRIRDLNSPTGLHTLSNNYHFTGQTDTIPATLNSNFGVEYMLESSGSYIINLETVWKFPGMMVNSSGQSFNHLNRTITLSTNQNHYSSYKFDEPYEIMPGIWEFQIYYNQKLLYSRKFTVVLIL